MKQISYLEIRLIAPLAVLGGKNSREKNLSPDTFLRWILSISRVYVGLQSEGDEGREVTGELLKLPTVNASGSPFSCFSRDTVAIFCTTSGMLTQCSDLINTMQFKLWTVHQLLKMKLR